MSKYLGENISPLLAAIADAMWEIESSEHVEPYAFTERAFPDAIKIFTTVCFDKLWRDLNKENISREEMAKRVENFGSDIRILIKNNLGVDTHKLYKKKELEDGLSNNYELNK